VYVVEVRTIFPKIEIDERLTKINSYVLNVGLGIAMLITMLFCIGSLDSALSTPAPYLQLFDNTGKTGVSLLLNIVLFLLIFSGNITALATCSREVWAFARDKGFPFSKWISHVSMSIFHSMVPYWHVNLEISLR
jgi:choline transport protein